MSSDSTVVSRICVCGLRESDEAWAAGGRACPTCKAPWPEQLRVRAIVGVPVFEFRATKTAEQVEHPQHYGGAADPFETIKVLKAWLSRMPHLTAYQAACWFNVVKYLSRAGLKGALVEDLKKARWYLDELIKDTEG